MRERRRCCIAGCQRRGRTVAEMGETKLVLCARCEAYVGARFEWLRRLDEAGFLTSGKNTTQAVLL